MLKFKKIAIVHDYLNQYGGAERVFEAFVEIFKNADIFTILYDKNKFPKDFKKKLKNRKIFFSFLQNIPLAKKRHDLFSYFIPYAIESFNFSKYDLIISSCSSYAKGIICPPDSIHISYFHTPTRYLWENPEEYVNSSRYSYVIKFIYKPFFTSLRKWDFIAAQRPDYIIANSIYTKKRIKKYYKRESYVIYPPVDIKKFLKIKKTPKNYYLVISRLRSYKRIDLVIKAFNKLGIPLKVAGEGPLLKHLKSISKNNIKFLGYASESQKIKLLKNAKAVIFPQVEDFGIVLIESLASGTPVIALKKGGAREIIKEGKTGIFFENQNEKDLIKAIKKFEKTSFDDKILKEVSKKFSKENFKKNILNFIKNCDI